ncbi:Adenosine 3'-phospho 5'-phosphosulfate transporter 2 [Seminavis robusta]|uniref:Adenosine 3'-phospho 5'-phosphosulfate transporter 2 n=1 Tax=Seminavis robusta TaxID=568900 RepID=A0A9N8E256_9STRA|nr:Adenosine 3'-phospho 5'-phosphosulfate transporter 2 [Seminavis robusta]|eukprot:Sro576_g169570.1 Adenosine 3'-phospho 5'-phosphosulfate transporter 2 (578) ;mRNA; r:51378-53111
MSYRTPVKDTTGRRRLSSPQSFVPMMREIQAYDEVSDDASITMSSQTSDDGNEVCAITADISERGLTVEDSATDGQGSISTLKSNNTETTHSSSHNLSQSLLVVDASSDHSSEQPKQDGTTIQRLYQNTLTPLPIRRASDLQCFDDLVSEPVLVLGVDISHLNRQLQFMVCASGVFAFSLLYGYLQELISVQICNRQLGLFLAMLQFIGYTVLSFIMKAYVYETHQKKHMKQKETSGKLLHGGSILAVPFLMYLGLSLLRAVDLGMTNLAMQYINYPAKTLMKSSRVVFTMIFGVFISRKKYQFMDYFVVFCMVAGLAIFMHADATSSAVFEPSGVIMLTISLLCDGAISNVSESIMKNYGVGQDEFIFKMYSIALVAISTAAAVKGDLQLGIVWLMQPGTYDEMKQGVTAEEASWSVKGKITVIVLFSTMGFFGSSCSAAITKNFGALTMSITSTARKATTVFLSFFLFNNVCTLEHIAGVSIFIVALTAKSLRRRKDVRLSATPSKMKDQCFTDVEMHVDSELAGGHLSNSLESSPARNPRGMKLLERKVSLSPQGRFCGTPGRRHNAAAGSRYA